MCRTTKITSVVPLSGTKPNWELPIDNRPSTILCRLFMVVHPCFTLDSCLCPEPDLEHHPFPCNSRQWNFAHSQLGPCNLYTFGQVGGEYGAAYQSKCRLPADDASRATTSPSITFTSVTSLHRLLWNNTVCITWPVCNEVTVTFLEVRVTEEQVISQCIFKDPLIPSAAM